MPYIGCKFAICIENSEYPASLELHKMYPVLPDEDAALDGYLRIIDESDEDYLYPAEFFLVLELPDDTEHILQESFSRRFEHAMNGQAISPIG